MSSPDAIPGGCIGVVNAGSSSVKFAIYEPGPKAAVRYRGSVDGLGVSPRLRIADAEGRSVAERRWDAQALDARAATREVLLAASELMRGSPIAAIGHRVVHGGMHFAEPIRVDATILAKLAELSPLAPLHQPHNLAGIEAIIEAAPHIPQVACFDTAFHRSQSPLAETYGLPRQHTDAGVRRYGFHGISYEYVAGRLREIAPALAEGRAIVAHLGNGASLCAMRNGRSVASTMGFSALEGLLMGTRSGSLDPGVLIYLMDQGMGPRDLETLLYRQSGLLGVSGVSSDMRVLRASTEPGAREAIELFVYRIVREAGSLAAALGGVDGFVFTAGIGENDAQARAEIAAGCAWLGLELDEARNAAGAGRISRDGSRAEAWVIPTDEERMIAGHTASVLGLG